MRFDNHQSIDNLLKEKAERVIVRLNSWENESRQAGQQYTIQAIPLGEWLEGSSSYDVAFREPEGFIKSIVEVLPKDYHAALRPSYMEVEWTHDLSEALLIDSESIRLLNGKGLMLKSTCLRLCYSSSRPQGWLGSIEQFPAQQALDRMNAKRNIEVITK